MALIQLNDSGTRAVLNRFNLKATRRIGKGLFCAVYEDGPDAVFKLTTDSIQRESVRDYLEGVHFPTMLEDIGNVGTQVKGDLDLYLFKSERLRPTKDADAPTRKLARQVIKEVHRCMEAPAVMSIIHGPGSMMRRKSGCTDLALKQLVESKALPESVREAFLALQRLTWNYDDLLIDFHGANLMVRGTDELVFNDVIVDGTKLFAN